MNFTPHLALIAKRALHGAKSEVGPGPGIRWLCVEKKGTCPNFMGKRGESSNA